MFATLARLFFRAMRSSFEHRRPRGAIGGEFCFKAFLVAGENIDGADLGVFAVLFKLIVVGPGIAFDVYLAGEWRSRAGGGVVGKVPAFFARRVHGQLLVGTFLVGNGLFANEVVALGRPGAIGFR